MSEIVFRSYSQGREAIQGFQADVVIIDEQPKDDFLYEALVRTVATDGQVICSFTPVLSTTGLLERLMKLKPLDDSLEDKFGPKYRSQDGWAMIRVTWEDITHISEEDKLQLRNGFAVDEANARTYAIQKANTGWELSKGVNIEGLARQRDLNKLTKQLADQMEALENCKIGNLSTTLNPNINIERVNELAKRVERLEMTAVPLEEE